MLLGSLLSSIACTHSAVMGRDFKGARRDKTLLTIMMTINDLYFKQNAFVTL